MRKIKGRLTRWFLTLLLCALPAVPAGGKEGAAPIISQAPEETAGWCQVRAPEKPEGGMVRLRADDQEGTALMVRENTQVTVLVQAEEGYRIGAVVIGGEACQVGEGTQEFETEAVITADTEVEAVFIRVYAITLCQSGRGSVVLEMDQAAEEQAAEEPAEEFQMMVDAGQKITVRADPEDYHRVEAVTVNGEADGEITGENFENGAMYVRELTADQDYRIVVSFAPNRYRVEAAPAEHGTVTIDPVLVDYGGSSQVKLFPEAGYKVESAQVNGKDQQIVIFEAAEQTEMGFALENIHEDKYIEVRFQEVSRASMDDFSIGKEGLLRAEDLLWVFSEGSEIVLETDKEGMELYDADGQLLAGGRGVSSITLTASADIGRVRLYYQAEGEWRPDWHEVEGLSGETPLRLAVDETAAEVRLTPSAPNENGIYNGDVTVDIEVEDTGSYSGIASVSYRIVCDGEETDAGLLYRNENGEICNVFEGSITVKAAENNSSQVTVEVRSQDRGGNGSLEKVDLDIDITPPSVRIVFDNNSSLNETYFDAPRRAVLVITERTGHFDAAAASRAIEVTAEDGTGRPVEGAWEIGGWTTEEDEENPDAATHRATVCFGADANYTWSVSCVDLAGNASNAADTADAAAPFAFTVDTTAPTGVIKAVSSEGGQETWNDLQESFAFGLISKERITLTGEFTDQTCASLAAVEYYRAEAGQGDDAIVPLSREELDQVREWTAFDRLEITSDEQAVYYVRITDLAGNSAYISTDGLMVDRLVPRIYGRVVSDIAAEPGALADGRFVYGGDVQVSVYASDFASAGVSSGLRTVSYRILNMGIETQAGILYEAGDGETAAGKPAAEWSGGFTVDSGLNNSNDVQLLICAQDNAGNLHEEAISIGIDITAPAVEVSYDNNEAAVGFYFNRARRATIVVTERNFRPENVGLAITSSAETAPDISSWTRTEEAGNPDDIRWTAEVYYSADGDYTFDIRVVDLAGNVSEGVNYGGSAAPAQFTVDQTAPLISVSYNNNDVRNDRYFAGPRTARIVVVERNFDPAQVDFVQTASREGEDMELPAISWTSDGDVHTARIDYRADGDYTLDVRAVDLAGNTSGETDYGDSAAAQAFTIDQTAPQLSVDGLRNGGAYSGEVIPVISFSDIHYDSCEICLLRTRLGEKNEDVTETFMPDIEEFSWGGRGEYDTFDRIADNDGIYRLTVRAVDLAGNEEAETLSFTLNRFGSVYVYGDYLISLIRDGGQYVTSVNGKEAVQEDLVITEYNPVRLLEGSLQLLVTRNGEAVAADYRVDYQEEPSFYRAGMEGKSGWHKYVYTIAASSFAEDGVYRISLSSAYATEDAGANRSASVPENSVDEEGGRIVDTMSFTVDTTAPMIRNISGLHKTIVDAKSQEVRYTVVDAGGLAWVEIAVNGEMIDRITDFGTNHYNYTGVFTLREAEGTQSIRITAADLAGNVTDTADENFLAEGAYIFNDRVTVSTNPVIRWRAGGALFWGGLAAMALLLILIIFGLCRFMARRRNT